MTSELTSQNYNQQVAAEVVADDARTLMLTPSQIAAVRLDSAASRFGTMPEETRRNWLRYEIGKLLILRGVEIDRTMVAFHASGLDEIIMADGDLRALTLPEMDAAFKVGLSGRYGEVYGVNASALAAWLNAYVASDVKQEATAIVRAKLASIRAAEKKAAQAKMLAEIEAMKARGEYTPNPRGWWKTDTAATPNTPTL